MDSAQYRRLKELFTRARDLPRVEQSAFLRRECGEDAELLAEARRLLESDRAASGDLLDRALSGDGGSATSTAAGIPAAVAGYRIVRVVGHGGMGTVYEAEQDAPKRRVALKVIQAGLLREETRRRFRREAEILGRLQHPGIAQVFEAGEFELNGVSLPFFAMEFVEGLPLVRYAEEHALSPNARIDVFLRVCDAVQHAHEQGVVHRDLKPDNVLVVDTSGLGETGDTRGQPKILDFGVAHLSNADIQATLSTGAGQLLGSVPYMSPEQASARPGVIDARSDVYSLGIVLFELLSGRMPYATADRPLAKALATIQEGEPARLGAVDGAYRGDLETIVGKALEKDPAWRYPSAGQLCDDLRRYRSNQPIAARPPSSWYQLRKFARRNRVLVGGAATTLLALALGLVLAIFFALRANENEGRALREAYRANLTATDALTGSDPLAARRSLYTVPAGQRGWEWRYLEARLSPQLLEFGQFFESSPLVAVDGGRHVIAGRDAFTLCRWDPTTGEPVETWDAPEEVTTWGIAEDGSRFAAGTGNGRVYVADRASGTWALWHESEAPALELVFSPDAARLAIIQNETLFVGGPGGWHSAPLRQRRHESHALAFRPDGERIAVAQRIGYGVTDLVLFTDELVELKRRDIVEGASSVQFSRDGTQLACGSEQRNLEFYDAQSLANVDSWLGHADASTEVVVGEHGLLSVSLDDTLRVWSAGGKCTAVLPAPRTQRGVFLSATRVVSAGADGLRLWGLDDESRRVLRGHDSYVYELAFSGDGNLLASHGPFGARELLVHDVLTGRLLDRRAELTYSAECAFSTSGHVRLGTDWTQTLVPWYGGGVDWQYHAPMLMHRWRRAINGLSTSSAWTPWTKPERATVFRTEYGVEAPGTVRLFADGQPLGAEATGRVPTLGERPRLYVGNNGTKSASHDGSISDLMIYAGSLSEDDTRAVEAYLDERRRTSTGRPPRVVSADLLAHFRADEETVATETDATNGLERVTRWSAREQPTLALVPVGSPPHAIHFLPADEHYPDRVQFDNQFEFQRWLEADFAAVRGLEHLTVFWLGHYEARWSSGGTSTAYSIGTDDRSTYTWPERDRRVRRIGVGESYSADGRLLALARRGHNTVARLRDTRTGELLHQFEPTYSGLDLHPDGHLLACGHVEGRLDIWDTTTFQRAATFPAHAGTVYCVAWSPDGTRLVTGGNDNVARVWDAATYEPLLELRGHDQYVKAVAFSPDGSMLATASGDGTVRLWDSIAPNERYQSVLASARLEDEVRPRVEGWLADLDEVEAVANRIRGTWSDDDERRRAAFVVLALSEEVP